MRNGHRIMTFDDLRRLPRKDIVNIIREEAIIEEVGETFSIDMFAERAADILLSSRSAKDFMDSLNTYKKELMGYASLADMIRAVATGKIEEDDESGQENN